MLVCPDTEAPYSLYQHVAGRPPSREHELYVALEDLRLDAKRSELNEEIAECVESASVQDSTAFQGTAQRVRVADWIADAQIKPRTTSPDDAADLAHARAAAVLEGQDLRVYHITTGEELELVPAVEEMEELLRAEDSAAAAALIEALPERLQQLPAIEALYTMVLQLLPRQDQVGVALLFRSGDWATPVSQLAGSLRDRNVRYPAVAAWIVQAILTEVSSEDLDAIVTLLKNTRLFNAAELEMVLAAVGLRAKPPPALLEQRAEKGVTDPQGNVYSGSNNGEHGGAQGGITHVAPHIAQAPHEMQGPTGDYSDDRAAP